MHIIGPRDPRLRRRRCINCVAAHVKCSGLLPCLNCTRRRQCCTYLPAQSRAILIETGKHITLCDTLSDSSGASQCVRKNVRNFDRYFKAFATTNNFSCAASAWKEYLRMSISRDAMVASAVTAVGSLHAYRTSNVSSKDDGLLDDSLNAYQEAVNALRKNLSRSFKVIDLCSTMSATFLLGLFESMYDQTGDGWQRHMMYGIARLLDVCGPAAFNSLEVRSLYREVRLFEITRAVLLSQSTALTQPSWLAFNQKLLVSSESDHSQEAIFDLMLGCADLARRVRQYIDDSSISMPEYIMQLQQYAAEGFALRQELMMLAQTIFMPQQVGQEHEQTVQAQLYYFTTMIYLSGVYDYDRVWQDHGILTPTLSQQLLCEHIRRILDHSTWISYNTSTSQLLLLVPLRIAAARSTTREQQEEIQNLLLKIQTTFAVAYAFLAEIKLLWASV